MTMPKPDTLDDVPLETIVNASPFTFALNRGEIVARLVKAETALALCVEALEAVEWIGLYTHGDHEASAWKWCPWCGGYRHGGHLDCHRQRALAMAKGD